MNKRVLFTSIILIIIAVSLICYVAPEYPCTESCVGCSRYGEFISDSLATFTGYMLIMFVMAWNVHNCVNYPEDKKHGRNNDKSKS